MRGLSSREHVHQARTTKMDRLVNLLAKRIPPFSYPTFSFSGASDPRGPLVSRFIA